MPAWTSDKAAEILQRLAADADVPQKRRSLHSTSTSGDSTFVVHSSD